MASKKYIRHHKKSTYVSKGTGSKIINTGGGSKALTRKARTTTYIRGGKEWTQTKLYKDTLKQVRQTNARIESLSRKHDPATWAGKKLRNKLDIETLKAWSGGKVKIPKNVTQSKLIAINKATRQFLQSATSTKSGINRVKRKTIDSLKDTLSFDGKKISDKDAEAMYDMLKDKDFTDLASKIDPSLMWMFIDNAINKDMSQDQFINMLQKHIDSGFDEDMREKAIRIYNEYVL